MEQEVLHRRNAVFDLFHRRATAFYALSVRKPFQWTIELLLLVMASSIFALWGYIHFTYMTSPADCLDQITEQPFPHDVILQVEVYSNSTRVWKEREYALINLYESTTNSGSDATDWVADSLVQNDDNLHQKQGWISKACANPVTFLTGTQFVCEMIFHSVFQNDEVQETDQHNEQGSSVSSSVSYDINTDTMTSHRSLIDEESEIAFFAENRTLYELLDPYSLKMLSFDYSILEFAQEPGYLSLTQSSRVKLNITVKKFYLDPEQATCFGGPFGKFLSKYFLGYDMMIIASYKKLLPVEYGSGFVKNLLTGDQYYYRVQWMGKWRYGAGILPTLFFTLVASVLLRQIHYHIFTFLTHFQHLINQGIPMPVQTGAQIPLMVVTYAGIGLVIVMSEALGDDSVFSLLMVATVWEADQFYSMFCKHQTSKQFFPWFFFLYHFLSYAYYIRFNGQFWFIPFVLHFVLLQHSMFFFFHRFELPRNELIEVQHNRRYPQQAQVYINPVQPHQNLAQEQADQQGDSDTDEPVINTRPLSPEESTIHVINSNFTPPSLESESNPFGQDVISSETELDDGTLHHSRQSNHEVVCNKDSRHAVGD